MTVASRHRIGLAQVATAGVLWGTGGVVVSVLHERHGLGALTVSAWRMMLAAAALLVFVVLAGRWSAVRDVLVRHPVLAVLAGVGTAAYQGLYFVAVLAAGVSVATVVSLGIAPVLAAGWEHLRAGTRPSGRELVVLTLTIGGLVLMSVAQSDDGAGHAPGTGQPNDTMLGIVLAAASGAIYAGTTLLGRRVASVQHQEGPIDSVAFTTVATVAGAVALSPFLVVAGLQGAPLLPDRPDSLLLLGYLGVITMALAYGLLYSGLRTVSGSAATVATLLEPIAAAVLAVLVLNESLTGRQVVGGVLILAGVVGLSRLPSRSSEHPTTPEPSRVQHSSVADHGDAEGNHRR